MDRFNRLNQGMYTVSKVLKTHYSYYNQVSAKFYTLLKKDVKG